MDRSKLKNMLVNIVAVVLLLGVLYSTVAFLIIPVSKFMWVMLIGSAKDGYQQFIAFVETVMHWDMAFYLLLGLSIYLVPTIIAFKKKHPSRRSIFFTNLFFGWSVIGWVLAMIWCYSTAESRRI